MEVRKRTRLGKSLRQNVKEPLRVVARDHINKTHTLSFTLDCHETEFNITLTDREIREVVASLGLEFRENVNLEFLEAGSGE